MKYAFANVNRVTKKYGNVSYFKNHSNTDKGSTHAYLSIHCFPYQDWNSGPIP